MQKPAAAFELIPGRRRIELLELSLQLLVDKQQALSAPRISPLQPATIRSMTAWLGSEFIATPPNVPL